MDYKEYLKKYNAQNKIDKLAKRYNKRKIILYAADDFSEIILKEYDLSSLNIVAVAGKNNEKYNCINENELTKYDCDLILIANYDYQKALIYLDDHILYRTKYEGIEIRPLIRLNLFDLLLKGN